MLRFRASRYIDAHTLTLILSSHAYASSDSIPQQGLGAKRHGSKKMPNDVEKEGEQARRRRVREENRRRENERRLEGQRREYARKCEALRRKAAAAAVEEEGDVARSQNESNGETRVGVDQLGDKEEPQPAATTTSSRSDGQRKRPKKPKRSVIIMVQAAETTSPAPVKKNDEHPELHVMIAQVGLRLPPPSLLTVN